MGLHKTVKSSYLALTETLSDNVLLDYKWFLEQEADTWDNWVELPLRRRLWLWKHGFPSPMAELYDFDTYGAEGYLSELQRYRLYRSLNDHRYLIDDKLSQHWMLAGHPEYRPTAYGFVDRQRVHGIAGTTFDGDPTPIREWLPEVLRRESELVFKDLRGKGGKEVLVAEYDGVYRLDGDPITEAELCAEIEDLSGYLVTEYVHQHEYADDLYPHSANTIRLLTLWDDEAGELLVPAAVHRIGTDRSRPVDNWSAGGLAADIEVESGRLGQAAQLPFSGEVQWFDEHPDTGTRIAGTTVPHWDRVLSMVERLAKENTNIPALGWDIVLDESGEPVVLEANTGTAIRTFQVHRPLLKDPRFAEFVSRHLPEADTAPSRRAVDQTTLVIGAEDSTPVESQPPRP